MTYGYETEPLADSAVRLGAPDLPRPVIDMVQGYARSLPVTAGHVVETGQRTYRIYWVSGSSLVTLETGKVEQGAFGFVIQGRGSVRDLRSAAVDLEVIANDEARSQGWSVVRRVSVTLSDSAESLTFPDPGYRLDDQGRRESADAFLDALLIGVTAT